MRVFLVEDEELSVERLERQLACFPAVKVVGAAGSIRSAVQWLSINACPDLILMDIELGDGQCFNIFRQTEINSGVIFITSFDESSMRVFKERGIDYLLKPVKIEDLHKCLSKYMEATGKDIIPQIDINGLIADLREQHQVRKIRQRILVRNGHGLKAVESDEIAYIFANKQHHYVKTWKKETYALDHSLDEAQNMLDPEVFHRLNKTFLVNQKSVTQLQKVSNYFKVSLQPAFDKEIIVNKDALPEFLHGH